MNKTILEKPEASHEINHHPVKLLEVELSQPIPDVAATVALNGEIYQQALVLVRLHSYPLGLLKVELDSKGLDATSYARQIWDALSTEIKAHFRQDHLLEIENLPITGLPVTSQPRCLQEREQFLSKAPFISVILPTCNRTELLERCLLSILASNYPASQYEIIVADNAPQNRATYELITRMSGTTPQLRYIAAEIAGSGYARECGLKAAKGEIVVFADDDVVVDQHWLPEIVKAFSVGAKVACVTGLIIPMELETPAQTLLEQYGGYAKGFEQCLYDMGANKPTNPLFPFSAGMFGSGANMAFKREILNQLGGFDPSLGAGVPSSGGEDIDTFFRAIIKGYTLVYVPSAIVHHPHRRDYPSLQKQVYKYGIAMTAFFTKILLSNPSLILSFIAKLPYGLYFTLSSRSPYHAAKTVEYPSELKYLELKGLLLGPLAYLRTYWWWRKQKRQAHWGLSGDK
jgi:GT2 family glycosyltransferase